MTVKGFYAALEAVAPKALSDEYCRLYGAYDNSGILVDCGGDVNAAVFTLDLTDGAIATAKKAGANLIVTHHPVIYGKIADVRLDTPLGGRLIACIQAGISVISMHLNLDCAVGGIDDCLADGIFGAARNAVGGSGERINEKRYHPLSSGGYGSVFSLAKLSASDLKKELEKEFSAQVRLVGKPDKTVAKAASFCGAGVDDSSVAFAISQGVDAIVSSDWKHHLVLTCHQAGVAVFEMSHYAAEEYGFEKYYEKMCKSVSLPCILHRESELL